MPLSLSLMLDVLLRSMWLGAFFHPRAMLAAVLQTFAQTYATPIDSLALECQVLVPSECNGRKGRHGDAFANDYALQLPTTPPSDGCYVHAPKLHPAAMQPPPAAAAANARANQ